MEQTEFEKQAGIAPGQFKNAQMLAICALAAFTLFVGAFVWAPRVSDAKQPQKQHSAKAE